MKAFKGGVACRDYVSYPWLDSGPIRYNTTTDDATRSIHVPATYAKPKRERELRSLSQTLVVQKKS